MQKVKSLLIINTHNHIFRNNNSHININLWHCQWGIHNVQAIWDAPYDCHDVRAIRWWHIVRIGSQIQVTTSNKPCHGIPIRHYWFMFCLWKVKGPTHISSVQFSASTSKHRYVTYTWRQFCPKIILTTGSTAIWNTKFSKLKAMRYISNLYLTDTFRICHRISTLIEISG